MKRPKFGDVIEIATSKGLAYAQYTHKNKMMGGLLRVLNEIHLERPVDFTELMKQKEDFWQFFPLGAAVNRQIVTIVANVPIPIHAQAFPIFRSGLRDRWWLWDGDKAWYVGPITLEQRKLSIKGCCNDTFLVEKIEAGWRPELGSLETPDLVDRSIVNGER